MKVLKFPKSDSISCLNCSRYPGDPEDIRNGMHVVCCEDGKIRCVIIEKGCAWFSEDEFSGITEVN